MPALGDMILVYGFDLDNLPDISSRTKPSEDMIPFLANETDVKSFPKLNAEDSCFIGVEVVSCNSESDIFQVVEEFNKNLSKKEDDYKLEIQHLITKIMYDINRFAINNMENYVFTGVDIDNTIDYLEGLKRINPLKLSFSYS